MTIGMLGTFDTKGEDFAYLREKIIHHGCSVIAMHIGVFEPTVSFAVQVSCDAFVDIEALRLRKDRPSAVAAIKSAFAAKLPELCKKYHIAGLIGAGGTNGTEIITQAMLQVSKELPKVCISTVANYDWNIQAHNILMIPSYVDVGGLNSISQKKYASAAAIIATLAKVSLTPSLTPKLPSIGISMFGNTTKCVERCSQIFKSKNFDVLPFHVLHIGSKNMEESIREGTIRAGVLDITLQKVSTRLSAPGDTQTPHLIGIGCVDMKIKGAFDEVRQQFPNRLLYRCNATVTAIRTNVKENRKKARSIAIIANAAFAKNSPVAILIPGKGFSMFDEKSDWHDELANRAFIEELLDATHPDIPIRLIDAFINDQQFADAAAFALLQLIDRQKLNWARPSLTKN